MFRLKPWLKKYIYYELLVVQHTSICLTCTVYVDEQIKGCLLKDSNLPGQMVALSTWRWWQRRQGIPRLQSGRTAVLRFLKKKLYNGLGCPSPWSGLALSSGVYQRWSWIGFRNSAMARLKKDGLCAFVFCKVKMWARLFVRMNYITNNNKSEGCTDLGPKTQFLETLNTS